MWAYLIDSMVLSAYLSGHRRAQILINSWIPNGEVVTSIVIYGEVYEFIRVLPAFPSMYVQLTTLLPNIIPTIAVDFPISERYADIRLNLRPRNQLIGDVDTLIAATALEHSLSIVTSNVQHFQRVQGLHVTPY